MFALERRQMDRYKVPGAWVIFDYGEGTPRAGVLKDISFSAVCFKSEKGYNPGVSMKMVISIPGINDINIKGQVLRAAKLKDKDVYYVVVQFSIFGTDPRYNSIYSYKQLKNLNDSLINTVH